jgi:hypothetical protein
VSLALEILTLVAGAFAMLLLVPRAARRRRVRTQRALPIRPADLERLERVVVTERAPAIQVHISLRPLLAEVAMTRLGRRRGPTPADARELLGDELWELVRPDRPRPEDPRAPGISLDQLAQMTGRLERL